MGRCRRQRPESFINYEAYLEFMPRKLHYPEIGRETTPRDYLLSLMKRLADLKEHKASYKLACISYNRPYNHDMYIRKIEACTICLMDFEVKYAEYMI